MADVNPIIQVYEALWQLLEADSDFTELVKAGNRVKYSTVDGVEPRVKPVKEIMQDADLPEVRIVSVSAEPHLQRTSNGSSMQRTFSLQIATGDLRYSEKLWPVEWAALRALSRWAETLLALTWNGKTFVKLVRPGAISEGRAESDLNRGISGWSTIWAITVDMWFTTSDLQATT